MMSGEQTLGNASAYGGEGWKPRAESRQQEIGRLWSACGINSEWSQLRAVLLHRPGPELENLQDPDAVHFIARPEPEAARAQHDAIAAVFRSEGIRVHYVQPEEHTFPNLMFLADLLFMTPEGTILARPASAVRAGEERWVARRIADLGVPILHSVGGRGTFEGADALWIRPNVVMLATGLRTNTEGADQVAAVLNGMGVEVLRVALPQGAMHLMGGLRLVSQGLALAWQARTPPNVGSLLSEFDIQTHFLPDDREALEGHSLNLVSLAENRILAPAGNPNTFAFYESLGLDCAIVEVGELVKAAGAIGCLTGVLERDLIRGT